MLTHAQIAHYLIADGLATTESIVDGNLEEVEATRRNSNFKVVSDRGPSYLLKQLKESSTGDTVANEARVYRFLQDMSAGDAILRYIPRVVKYDAEQRVLVVELLRNSKDLYEHCQRYDRVPVIA